MDARPSATDDRAVRIATIIDAVTERLEAGERIGWDDLRRLHTDLMPELGEQLATLQAILDAEAAADEDAAGPASPQAPAGGLLDTLNREMPGYRFLEVIHAGGQGTVFKALQVSTHRLVAVKVMHDGAVASERRRQRFEREIKLTSHLQLPNIVQVYDSGVVQGQYFFVMQYVDGMAIDDYALLNCHSARERVGLVAETMRAISRAHQRGVIHRDLKPTNLLIDAEGAPQILDFGLAKALSSAGDDDDGISMIGHVVGTLPYLSPEQATGFDEVDVRGDIYAMGVVLFELLTGEYPYDLSGTREQSRSRILREPPRHLRDVAVDDGWTGLPKRAELDDDLEAIVAKALAKDKEERYPSADHMVADLDAYLRGDAVSARADQGAYLLRKALKRYRRHLVAASAIAVVMLIAAVVSIDFWLQARAERDNARQVAILAQGTLDDVVTEIDNTIAPLAGGTAAREHLLKTVAANLDALEPLVASDVAMDGVLRSLHEKQGDVAAATGRSSEAHEIYAALIETILDGQTLETASDEDLFTLSRLYRKRSGVSAEPAEDMREAVAVARLLEATAPPEDALHELCQDLVELARVEWRQGEIEAAVEPIDEALAILETLPDPNVLKEPRWQGLSADALNWDGQVRIWLGDGARARASLEEAIAIRSILIAERPQDVQVQYKTMVTLTALAGVLRDQKEYAESADRATEAVALGDNLVRAEPQNAMWCRDLIVANRHLINARHLEGDHPAAVGPASAMVELADRLVVLEPESAESLRSRGLALATRGYARQLSGDAEEGLTDLEQALDIDEELLDRDPNNLAYLDATAYTHGRLASCLAQLKRYEASWQHSVAQFDLAVQLRTLQPEVGDRHVKVIWCLNNMAAWHIRQRTLESYAEAQRLLDEADGLLWNLRGTPLLTDMDGLYDECAEAIDGNRLLIVRRLTEGWKQ
ncbi:MAG: serine/threonine protein kinase [Phycisphaerales bacterium]|nr:serine/threonine protein kinase [Phycisphaerales bacterium]